MLLLFGKHRGKSYNTVRQTSPHYTSWVIKTFMEETEANPELVKFGEWLVQWALVMRQVMTRTPEVAEDPDPLQPATTDPANLYMGI